MIVPGVAVHVVQRGNNRADCFADDADCRVYLANLRALAPRAGCDVHAYCMMTNHVHLLLTPQLARACSGLMKDLGQRYTQYFNRRHGRSGTLWEGRFRSCMVESSRYVLACYRYIELNPSRARMVDHPSDYHWSSYAVNAGMRSDPLLTPHCEYLAIAGESTSRHTAYRSLVEEGVETSLLLAIRRATSRGEPLASDGFTESLTFPARKKSARVRAARPGSGPAAGSDPAVGSDPDLVSGGGAS